MTALDITPDEIASGTLSPAHVKSATDAIKTDGFVVLNNVVDIAHLDILHAKMLDDIEHLLSRKDAPFNWTKGNIQQDPPPFPPFLFEDILLNKQVIHVTRAILGDGVKNTFYSGNTAMPSETRQPVHVDEGQLWPEVEVAHPAVKLVVNIPTVDISRENGSTEIWPGTHKDITITAGKDIEIPRDVLEKRRATVPPIQPSFRRGGVLIRDMRLWHAGMPNHTDQPRPMIAMIHVPGWLQTGDGLPFPKGTEDFFRNSQLRTPARFVDDPIDHIGSVRGYKEEMAK